MWKFIWFSMTAFLFSLGGLPGAQAITVMDFDSLTVTGLSPVSSPYVEDGFMLEGISLTAIGPGPNYIGSIAMENDNQDPVVFSMVGGGTFEMLSIDLGPFPPFTSSDGPLTITGNLSGGGQVQQTFTVLNNGSFQTFNFDSSFTNVESIEWSQTSPFHQFDNITVVPEPFAVSLMLAALTYIGLAGLWWMGRKAA